MASCGPERCDYCGNAPCVGEDCPSNWDDGDDWGRCSFCGRPLSPADPDDLCARCRGVDDDELYEDVLDHRDYEADP